MQRAATYARFSTDLQNDRSVEDQHALCRTFAEREGLNPILQFEDRAQSGATLVGRNGIARLMRAAQDGQYSVLIVEALDRLSRDQEDLAHIWKRLSFLGIEIRAVHDGTADAIQVGIRGLLGNLYLADLAHKVRRGMDGVVRDGRHAGGKAYGYAPVPGQPGELEIVSQEADFRGQERIKRKRDCWSCKISNRPPRSPKRRTSIRTCVSPRRGVRW